MAEGAEMVVGFEQINEIKPSMQNPLT